MTGLDNRRMVGREWGAEEGGGGGAEALLKKYDWKAGRKGGREDEGFWRRCERVVGNGYKYLCSAQSQNLKFLFTHLCLQ